MIQLITIDDAADGQRIDNFLIKQFKKVPKTRIYRAVRKGEVRVNKKRIKVDYKLMLGDEVRLPPLSVPQSEPQVSPKLKVIQNLDRAILFEDEYLLILNKPANMAVHGGSGVSFGVIEALRQLRPNLKFLELVHRLDKPTSGCLMIAKKRSALRYLHGLLRARSVEKHYHALVKGSWPASVTQVTAPLKRLVLASGERRVHVDEQEGKSAETQVTILEKFETATLIDAYPVTGRTHQIRVHARSVDHPLAGDEKYGDETFNQSLTKLGLERLFLHAASLRLILPGQTEPRCIEAPLPESLKNVLAVLRQ